MNEDEEIEIPDEEVGEEDSFSEETEEEFGDRGGEDGGNVQAEVTEKTEAPTLAAEQAVQAQAQIVEIERARHEKEQYQKGRVEGLIGIKNHFNGQAIADRFDAEEYIQMLEAEKAGYDPTSDMSKYQKDIARKEFQIEQLEASRAMQGIDITSDSKAFVQSHQSVDIDALFSNSKFMLFAEGKLGTMPLAKVYEGYQSFVGDTKAETSRKAQQLMANAKASPGSLSGGGNVESKGYEQMSSLEFKAHLAAVKRKLN